MLWLQIIHGLGAFLPWLIVIYVRNPRILLLAIMWNFLLVVQWVILGKCVISPIENNGSRYSAMHEALAAYIGIPVRDFTKGFILIMSVAPTCAIAALLFYYLDEVERRLAYTKKIMRRNR